jgi:hypothetical protein
MKMFARSVVALAAFALWSVSAAAQTQPQPPAPPAAPGSSAETQDSLVRDALARYQAGLDAIQKGTPVADGAPSATLQANRPVRELRMSDVVQLALEKNLDIAVERLNPQAVDLQIAGLRNTYLPTVTSAIGQRDNTQLPRDQLQGGQRVSVATTTYQPVGSAHDVDEDGTDAGSSGRRRQILDPGRAREHVPVLWE